MFIVDAHTHIRNVAENFKPLYALAQRLGYSQLTVQSLQCTGDLLQNMACALCKCQNPAMTYAFGGLDYASGRDFLTQVKNLRAMGFDGVKMLEGKPTTRKLLGKALDDPDYDAFYDYLEENAFPVLFHVADPPEFWDREKVPSWAFESGWFYGKDHVPYAQFYDEVDRMLMKHPRLRAIFAHFYFLSGEPEKAQRFLDDHPSVSLDVTAGVEMYQSFSKDPGFWREFFIKNSHRIIFGTDSTDESAPTPVGNEVDIRGYADMEIDFLRYDKPLEIYGMQFHGLGLPQSVLESIFSKNFHSYVGTAPRPMDTSALRQEAECIRGLLTTPLDRQTLDSMLERLG